MRGVSHHRMAEGRAVMRELLYDNSAAFEVVSLLDVMYTDWHAHAHEGDGCGRMTARDARVSE